MVDIGYRRPLGTTAGLVSLVEVIALGPRAEDQVQWLGQLQTQAGIQAVLALSVGVVVAAVIGVVGRFVPWRGIRVEDIHRATGSCVRRGPQPAAVDALIVSPDHQLVVQPIGLEVAGQVAVVQVLFVFLTALGAIPDHSGMGIGIYCIEGSGGLEPGDVPDIGVRQVEFPVVIEAVVVLGKILARGGVGERPVLGQARVARQAEVGTVAVTRH
ncbi:hypothetical protein D3C84_765560 [compost metagenome]